MKRDGGEQGCSVQWALQTPKSEGDSELASYLDRLSLTSVISVKMGPDRSVSATNVNRFFSPGPSRGHPRWFRSPGPQLSLWGAISNRQFP